MTYAYQKIMLLGHVFHHALQVIFTLQNGLNANIAGNAVANQKHDLAI